MEGTEQFHSFWTLADGLCIRYIPDVRHGRFLRIQLSITRRLRSSNIDLSMPHWIECSSISRRGLPLAGRKQHIIPRHFQRPFAQSRATDRIWLYRKGLQEPKSVSITDAAAQRDFYSKPSADGLPTLDQLITDYEQSLQKTIDHIRSLDIRDNVPADKIAEVVTHLSVRSQYLRGMAEEAITSMADAFDSAVDGHVGGQEVSFPAHCVPKALEKIIVEELNRLGFTALTPVSANSIAKLLYFVMRENAHEVLPAARKLIERLTGELAAQSGKISRRVQTSVLTGALAPRARQEVLRELHWTIETGPPRGAILPDCTCIVFDGKRWTSLFLAESEKVEFVILPISPERLVVGRRSPSSDIDITEFNRFAANVAHTFFLSSERHEELDGVANYLGGQVRTQMRDMTSSAVAEAVDEYASDHMPQDKENDSTAGRSWMEQDGTGEYTFSVNFRDFVDKKFARDVSEELKSAMIAFDKHFPLAGPKWFVFANDYRAVIDSIDPGLDAPEQLSPIEDDTRAGVGCPFTVLVDGKIETLAVLHCSIAQGLVSAEDNEKVEARRVILHILAAAALAGLTRNRFPEQMLGAVEDDYEGTLLRFTHGVFDAYFCSSFSCLDDRMVELHERLAREAFEAMSECIPRLIKQFMEHRDMDRLFPESASHVGSFLLEVARYLGCLRCNAAQLDDGGELVTILAENGLSNWLSLFRKDLETFDSGLESWTHFEEAFFINRHFERLGVHFGLFPEPTTNRQVYIYVESYAKAPDAPAAFREFANDLLGDIPRKDSAALGI